MENILGVFGINWKLLAVQIVNFGILLLVLWYFLYRPVVAMLERRRLLIEKGVQDAKDSAVKLSEVAEEKKIILSGATAEAENIVLRAEERGAAKERDILDEAEKKTERLIRESEMRAREEQRKIMEASREEIAKLAVLGMEKLLREKAK